MNRLDERGTERLIMRRWTAADREPFAAMNADPAVTRFLPAPISRAASDAMVDRIETGFQALGYGLWALERRDTGEFIGFTGLAVPRFEAAFTPAVEVGWRLRHSAWGNGYATEAGAEALRVGFDVVGLDEIVSFTVPANEPSRRVMQRLGLTHDPADDFHHPLLVPASPLRRHVLYRISRTRFAGSPAGSVVT